MQMPTKTSGYEIRVRFGDHVSASVEGDANPTIAALQGLVDAGTNEVLAKAAAWEASRRLVTRATARRRKARAQLLRTVQAARKRLEGDTLQGTSQPEYRLVFDKGLEFWRTCPVTEVLERFTDFKARLEAHLPEGHPVRLEFVPRVDADLASFETKDKGLSDARGARRRARTTLDAEQATWTDLLARKVWGTLIAELGEAEANGYFPSAERDADEEDDVVPAPPA